MSKKESEAEFLRKLNRDFNAALQQREVRKIFKRLVGRGKPVKPAIPKYAAEIPDVKQPASLPGQGKLF